MADGPYFSSLKLAKHPPIAWWSRRRQGTQTFAFGNRDIHPPHAWATLARDRDTGDQWDCLEESKVTIPDDRTAYPLAVRRPEPPASTRWSSRSGESANGP